MTQGYERLIIELPKELKERYRAACRIDMTDMSTKTRELVKLFVRDFQLPDRVIDYRAIGKIAMDE